MLGCRRVGYLECGLAAGGDHKAPRFGAHIRRSFCWLSIANSIVFRSLHGNLRRSAQQVLKISCRFNRSALSTSAVRFAAFRASAQSVCRAIAETASTFQKRSSKGMGTLHLQTRSLDVYLATQAEACHDQPSRTAIGAKSRENGLS